MISENTLYLWALILLAFVATDMWRWLGVLLAHRIAPTSLLMKWINAVAYAMVCGVMVSVVVHPAGLVASSSLLARLAALLVTMGLMVRSGNTLASVVSGASVFMLLDWLIVS